MEALKIVATGPVAPARDILLLAGLEVTEEREVPFGVQFRLDRGRMANVYSTGAVVPQGARSDTIRRVFEVAISKSGASSPLRAAALAHAPRPAIKAPRIAHPASTIPGETTSGRHPEWSDEPWDGVTPPFVLG